MEGACVVFRERERCSVCVCECVRRQLETLDAVYVELFTWQREIKNRRVVNLLALSSSPFLARACAHKPVIFYLGALVSWAFLLAFSLARGVSLCQLPACRAMCVCVSGMSRRALGSSLCLPELRYCLCFPCTVLLQHGADANIRNTDGKSALDLAEPSAKAVLTGKSTEPSALLLHLSIALSPLAEFLSVCH